MPDTPKQTSWCEHFPLSKIKGVLQAQKEAGQLREPVVRMVSAASALFINDLVKSAQPADGKLVTLADLKRAVQSSEQYSAILDEVATNIDDVDDTNPYQVKKVSKTAKRSIPSTSSSLQNRKRIKPDALIDEAMNFDEQNIEQSRPLNAELVIDEDDYD